MPAPILVVDDDRTSMTLLVALLRKAGYDVVTALDTLQAVQQAQRSQPSLVLMDLLMPGGGGIAAIERLALSGRTSAIPVFVLTGSQDPGLEARALAAGAIGVFRKPFDWNTLSAAIGEALQGGRPATPPAGQGGGAAASAPSGGASAPPAIEGTTVEFASGADRLAAYLAKPAAGSSRDRRRPAVIVIQEIWGLTPHIRDVAERFARERYVALAPDMYSREGGAPSTDLETLRKLALGIPDRRIVGDLRAACDYLRERPDVRADRIGTVGFCMGGAWALLLACHEPIQAAVDFYGRVRYPELSAAKPRHPLDYVPGLRCPLLGLFAGADAGIPVEHAHDLERAARQSGKTIDLHVYPEAPHAFFNDQRESHRQTEAADAWRRTLEWFGRHLGEGTG
jgi:carboxymethylenebutenolidase